MYIYIYNFLTSDIAAKTIRS